MTKKERLQADLAKLEVKLTDLIKKGKLIQSCQIRKQIEEKQQAIKDCEYYEYVPLNQVVSSDELTKHKVYTKLLEIAIAADYLVDCAIEAKDTLSKLGVGHLKLLDDVEIIRKHANKLSAMPCDTSYSELYDLMMDNDGLIDSLHILSRNYMRTKLDDPKFKV